jgi:hypothetical protein
LSEQKQGYVYRSAGLTDTTLAALLAAVFGEQAQVWAFGMNSIHLQPITQQAISTDLATDAKHGALTDGHAFTAAAEVRWKRRDGTYDALVLTEDMALISALATDTTATAMCLIDTVDIVNNGEPRTSLFAVSPPTTEENPIVLTSRSEHERLGYREYCRKNHDVVFVRFTVCDPEPRRQS